MLTGLHQVWETVLRARTNPPLDRTRVAWDGGAIEPVGALGRRDRTPRAQHAPAVTRADRRRTIEESSGLLPSSQPLKALAAGIVLAATKLSLRCRTGGFAESRKSRNVTSSFPSLAITTVESAGWASLSKAGYERYETCGFWRCSFKMLASSTVPVRARPQPSYTRSSGGSARSADEWTYSASCVSLPTVAARVHRQERRGFLPRQELIRLRCRGLVIAVERADVVLRLLRELAERGRPPKFARAR